MIVDISSAVKVSMRRATTALDRSNLTIINVLYLGNEIMGSNYSADDFFQFYDQALEIDVNRTINGPENFYSPVGPICPWLKANIRVQGKVGCQY